MLRYYINNWLRIPHCVVTKWRSNADFKSDTYKTKEVKPSCKENSPKYKADRKRFYLILF